MDSAYHHYKDDFFFSCAMIFLNWVLKFEDLLTFRSIWDVTGRVESFYQLWILSVGIDFITFGGNYTGKGSCHLLSFFGVKESFLAGQRQCLSSWILVYKIVLIQSVPFSNLIVILEVIKGSNIEDR